MAGQVEGRREVIVGVVRGWAPAILMMATILTLSSLRGSPIPGLDLPYADKVVHATVYAVLGALLLRALWLTSERFATWLLFVPVVLFVSGFGGLDEFYQGFVPHRTPEFLDWVADSSGGFVGALAMLFFRFYRQRSSPVDNKALR